MVDKKASTDVLRDISKMLDKQATDVRNAIGGHRYKKKLHGCWTTNFRDIGEKRPKTVQHFQ